MPFKKKRSSQVISIINFVLSLMIFVFYALSIFYTQYPKGIIFSSDFYACIQDMFKNLDFLKTTTYLDILVFYIPPLLGIAGLFGKLTRIVNILPLIGFVSTFIGYIAYQGIYASSSEFLNFTSVSYSFFSCIFFVSILGCILSFINLVKSK